MQPWFITSELPHEVFMAFRKQNCELNPTAILATVNLDGTPHTAPFGSFRAVTPQLIRFVIFRGHKTFKNLSNNSQVALFSTCPPDIAVSINGIARTLKEQMDFDPQYAIVEISIYTVKNNMFNKGIIKSGITISPFKKHEDWFKKLIGELEELEIADDESFFYEG